MEHIGRPVVLQNTDTGFLLVECDRFLTSTSGEYVSFASLVRKRPSLTIGDMQREAIEGAIAKLQDTLARMAEPEA